MLETLIRMNRIDSDFATELALSIDASKYDFSTLSKAFTDEEEAYQGPEKFGDRALIREILGDKFFEQMTLNWFKDIPEIKHQDTADWLVTVLEFRKGEMDLDWAFKLLDVNWSCIQEVGQAVLLDLLNSNKTTLEQLLQKLDCVNWSEGCKGLVMEVLMEFTEHDEQPDRLEVAFRKHFFV